MLIDNAHCQQQTKQSQTADAHVLWSCVFVSTMLEGMEQPSGQSQQLGRDKELNV